MRTNFSSRIITKADYCLQCGWIIIPQTEWYVPRFSNGWMWVLHAPAHHGSVWTRRLPAVVLFSSLHTAPCMYCMMVFRSTQFMFRANSAVRQIQCANKTIGSGWYWSQEEKHFQCVLQCHEWVWEQSCQSSMPRMIRYDLISRFSRFLMCLQDQRGGEGSCTGVDQWCGSGCGVLCQACPGSVNFVCVQHDSQHSEDKRNGDGVTAHGAVWSPQARMAPASVVLDRAPSTAPPQPCAQCVVQARATVHVWMKSRAWVQLLWRYECV